jgi:hypothetical protein
MRNYDGIEMLQCEMYCTLTRDNKRGFQEAEGP